jgi:hypothetical protein
MMMKKIISIIIMLLIATVFIGGCSSKQESKQESKLLVLKEYGPTETKAGQVFNKQPDGESAFWATTENVTPTTVMVLNGVQLVSAPQQEGRAITALVPKKLYEHRGDYSLYLLDTKTGNKSNELTFIVKP